MTNTEILKDCERQPVECWTRVMGYFRPVSYFNEGKKSEFKARKWFKEERIKRPLNFCEIKKIILKNQ